MGNCTVIRKTLCLAILGAVWFSIAAGPVYSQTVHTNKEGEFDSQEISVPYGFYNDHFGAAAAWVYAITGEPQDQSSLIVTGMVGTEGSAMVALIGQDLQLPWTDRWFVDPVASIGYFGENDIYIDGNPNFAGERAGTNDSDEDNFIEGEGWDNFLRARFKYLLPIGEGQDMVTKFVKMDTGFPVETTADPNSLNPFNSGRSYLELLPFYRNQQVDSDDAEESEVVTNGLEVALRWDNRDFPQNPTAGHSIRARGAFDFGWFDSTNSWSVVDLEVDKYVSFGSSKYLRQSTLAFDIWTADTPSWDDDGTGSISNRAPAYAGATLGGLWRMRAYPSQRFNDRSAIYYSAEWRVTPKWNPFNNYPSLQKHIGVEWIQFAPFIEVGRVADKYSFEELHSDMKVSGGIGFRALAKGLLVRADVAASEEGGRIQMMVGQPFQF